MKYAIKSRYAGSVLYEANGDGFRAVVEAAKALRACDPNGEYWGSFDAALARLEGGE